MAIPLHFFDIGVGTHENTATPRAVGLTNAGTAQNHAVSRKVRAGNNLHELIGRGLRIVNQIERRINAFAQIMRGNVGGHADRNTGRTIDHEVRECGRQNCRLHHMLIKVRAEIDRILVDVGHHFLSKFGETCFRITIGGRRVAVAGTEVAVAVHQGVAHGKILS